MGERPFIFSGLGSKKKFWVGVREQGPVEKHFRELERKVIFLSESRKLRTPHPLPSVRAYFSSYKPFSRSPRFNSCIKEKRRDLKL